jgi:hypothetical protein
VDRHGRGAEHHLDVEGDLVEGGHVDVLAAVTASTDHAMVTAWLMRATDCPSG